MIPYTPEALAVLPTRIAECREALLMPRPAAVKSVEREPPLAGSVRRVAGMPYYQVGRVAVIPLAGFITQRPNWLTAYGFGTSVGQFVAAHAELAADPAISGIVWDVDSPGGSVAGVA